MNVGDVLRALPSKPLCMAFKYLILGCIPKTKAICPLSINNTLKKLNLVLSHKFTTCYRSMGIVTVITTFQIILLSI